jgi:hypothetical protein
MLIHEGVCRVLEGVLFVLVPKEGRVFYFRMHSRHSDVQNGDRLCSFVRLNC